MRIDFENTTVVYFAVTMCKNYDCWWVKSINLCDCQVLFMKMSHFLWIIIYLKLFCRHQELTEQPNYHILLSNLLVKMVYTSCLVCILSTLYLVPALWIPYQHSVISCVCINLNSSWWSGIVYSFDFTP